MFFSNPAKLGFTSIYCLMVLKRRYADKLPQWYLVACHSCRLEENDTTGNIHYHLVSTTI
jgi:hypothetical protein